MNGEKKCGLYFAHAQYDHNFCILSMFKDTFFLLDVHLGYNKEHYENKPIQIYWKFYHQKMKIFW